MTVEPRKVPRQDRAKQTREILLDAAALVIVKDGWDKASTNRIARVAGVSVGSLYQYFPNKEALVVALARRHAAEMLELLAHHAMELRDAPLDEAIAGFVRAMVAAHRVEPELHVALVHRLLATGLAPVEELLAQANALVAAWLRRHGDELRVDDPDVAAWMCVTTTDAVVHAAVLAGRQDDPAVERELTSLLLRYLARTASER